MQSTTCRHCGEPGIYYVPPTATVPGYWLCHQHWQTASLNSTQSEPDRSGYGVAPPPTPSVQPPAPPVWSTSAPRPPSGRGAATPRRSSAPHSSAPRSTSASDSTNKGVQIAAGVIGAILAQVAIALLVTKPWNDRPRRPAPPRPISQPIGNDWFNQQHDQMQQDMQRQFDEMRRQSQQRMEDSRRRMEERMQESKRRMEELRNRHRNW